MNENINQLLQLNIELETELDRVRQDNQDLIMVVQSLIDEKFDIETDYDNLLEQCAVKLETASIGGKVYEGLQFGAYIIRDMKL